MLFSSIDFIFQFLPIFLIGYYLAPKNYKNIILLIVSLIFYAWGDGLYTLLLLLSVLVNFVFGKLIAGHGQPNQTDKLRRIFLWVSIAFNFGLLVLFKYTDFIIENINALIGLFGASIPPANMHLPLGISYFTFMSVSYLVDVYRGEIKPSNNIVSFGSYITMFPKLISGPITEFNDLAPELRSRTISVENIENGLRTFIIGMGAKVILADNMSTLWAGMSRYGYESMSTPYAWLGAIGYSFQLYFDFLGYSLMAMGVGTMLGLTIPKNFDHPYTSRSISEFWRRWHMTLGRWFKKYIYFPLGGSRCSTGKIVRNTLIVWAFTGLWHGASWNFVLWGLFFFGLIMLERFWLGKYLAKSKILSHVYVCFIIPLTWVVFAISDMGDIAAYFSRLFPFGGSPDFVTTKDFWNALGDYWYLIIGCIIFSLPYPAKLYERYKDHFITNIILIAIFIISMVLIKTTANNPFLYFRF
ncbi:MAG: MBOAT family protein [Oscillospiraceae bacterium]|nr:MBOAT family protein [Oscillospiraceae bacterium]